MFQQNSVHCLFFVSVLGAMWWPLCYEKTFPGSGIILHLKESYDRYPWAVARAIIFKANHDFLSFKFRVNRKPHSLRIRRTHHFVSRVWFSSRESLEASLDKTTSKNQYNVIESSKSFASFSSALSHDVEAKFLWQALGYLQIDIGEL